jgi:hypothetical protein
MKKTLVAIALLIAVLLAACAGANPEPTATPIDVNALQTKTVQTVIARVTETAAAIPTETPTVVPPTETPVPLPTETSTPAGTPTLSTCDDAIWIADVSYPDGTPVTAGQEFIKTWRVKNTGSCTWTAGYQIMWAYGDNRMGGQATALTGETLPNTEAEISLNLRAPTKPGTYNGYWILRNNNGYTFGQRLSVTIVVP